MKVQIAEASIPAGSFSMQAPGEFLNGNLPVPSPKVEASVAAGLNMMTHLVSQAEYAACVDDGGCRPLDRGFRNLVAPEYPAIGVNWNDATAYAQWLSRRSGQPRFLPDYPEWVRPAAEGGKGAGG